MPVAEQSKVFINFSGGLNTEATALNFPENAATDLDNMVVLRTGESRRRLGVDFEDAYTIRPRLFPAGDFSTSAISSHEWKAVNGRGELDFLVIQIGLKLYFHDLGSEPMSATERGTLDLTPFRINSDARTLVIDTSYGEGRMMVANRGLDPLYVEYDEDSDTFTGNKIDLMIRDFDGIDEGTDDELRPSSLSTAHKYNLRNQGWPKTIRAATREDGDDGTTVRDPIQDTKDKINVYPSNADVIHLAKLGGADKPESIGAFHPKQLEKLSLGNTPAARGHFIFSPFNRDRSAVSGIVGVQEAEFDTQRPSTTAFYAGRTWFAGVPSSINNGDIFFSQILTDMKNAGKCYQDQDPTAEDLNGLLATDGGVIHIADMGRVQRMIPIGQDLVIVASNGIWAVSGDGSAAFTANSIAVRHISDIGTLARDSVLLVEGDIFFWNEGGIYQMTSGQITDSLVVNRITDQTIQTFYDAIPEASRAYARGFYDDFSKRIFWFYNDTADAINFRFDYNKTLVFDLSLQAFYPYSFNDIDSGDTPIIAAMTQKTPGSEEIINFEVLNGTDSILETANVVCQNIAFPSFADTKLKLLTFVRDLSDNTKFRYTFSEFKSREFLDWTTWDQLTNGPLVSGADYDSVIQTGFSHLGDPLPLKHLTHITSYFNRTEDGFVTDSEGEIQLANPSGAKIQTRWEWSDFDAGRWTKLEDAYRLLRVFIPDDDTDPFNYGETVIKTKLRMRGKGHAFSVRYESVPGKDMQLLGFGLNIRAGTKL